MCNDELKDIIEKQSNEKIEHYASSLQALKDLTDLGNADENMAQDYAGRFAFELLQNGADAYQKASNNKPDVFPHGKGKVNFSLVDNYLIVANTGTPFSHEPHPGDREDISSIESISRLGESTKSSGEYIGNKGIGFRSIYQICSRFWLISGGYNICYDGKKTYNYIKRYLGEKHGEDSAIESCCKYLDSQKDKIPMLKVGFWFEQNELPDKVNSIINSLQEEKYDTILILDRQKDMASKTADRAFVWDRLASLSEKEILFLNTLSEVHCRNYNMPVKNFILKLESTGDYRVVKKTPDGNEWRFLVFSFPMPGLDKAIQQAQIAFQLDENCKPIPTAIESRVFYTFYPATKERHGLPFYIHSYFILNPNREYFNFETKEKVERNRELLESLVENFISSVLPRLRNFFPEQFLPDIIMPTLNDVVKERLADLQKQSVSPTFEFLSREGALTAWFISKLIKRLIDEELIRDLRGDYLPLKQIKRVVDSDPIYVQSADRFFASIGNNAILKEFPSGFSAQNEKLNKTLADVESYVESDLLTINSLVAAIELIDQKVILEPIEAESLIIFLSGLATGHHIDLKEMVERIRHTRQPFLPCRGDNNNQPFPQYPEQGKLIRATIDSPLVFFSPSMADVEEEVIDDMLVEENTEITEKLNLPSFCHVHVLKDEVLNSVPQVDADRMRSILKDQFGLRPFKPEDIFNRIAESTLTNEPVTLDDEQHREFLEVTLRLIERQRLKGRVAKRDYSFTPWYLAERDSKMRLYYFLAKSFIPKKDGWERGNNIILAGELSVNGEKIRPVYSGTDQVFLTADNEAKWFVDYLDSYFERLAGKTESVSPDDLNLDKIRFRSYVYRLLGAWDGLRFDVIYQQAWKNEPMQANYNPHSFISSEEWQTYMKDEEIKSPWSSYSLNNCRLVTSAAIPYCRKLASFSERSLVIDGLQKALPVIEKHSFAEISSPNNSPGRIVSYLFYQLKNYPWVESELRDQAIQMDAPIWFTRQDIPMKTYDRQSAHYLRSATARHMSERLARALKMPVLEDANVQQLPLFTDLYCSLCNRVEQLPPPGPGFLTLYQAIVSKIQQIILSQERQSDERIAEAQELYKEIIKKILDAGIIVFDENNGSLNLSFNIKNIYYDDTGVSNSIFRSMLKMVAFDDTSQGFSRLLGIKLLSRTGIQYDIESDDETDEQKDVEIEIQQVLNDLKVPLFAFRAFSIFTPEGQRLKLGEDTYDRRWKMFEKIKVKVVSDLKVTIKGIQSLSVPSDIPVVLEHESSVQEERRLFIRSSILTGNNRIPIRTIARPLAIALGSESQTIAVEMLLKQYEDGLDSVYEYLTEQCGITAEHIREIEGYDERLMVERNRQIEDLEAKIFDALRDHCINESLDKQVIETLRLLLQKSLSVNSPDFLDYVQNKLKVPLHLLASKLDIKKSLANFNRFEIIKGKYKKRLLLKVVKLKNIEAHSQVWEQCLSSYSLIQLDEKLQYYWQPKEDSLWEPIKTWLAEQMVTETFEPKKINTELSEEENKLWNILTEDHNKEFGNDSDDQMKAAILNLFYPWVIALSKKTREQPVVDLLDGLDSYSLEELVKSNEPLEEIRLQFEDYLKKYYVPQIYIDALFLNWPEISNKGTGLEISYVEKVRLDIEKLRFTQQSQSEKAVKKYVTYIDGLIQENKVKTIVSNDLIVKPEQEGVKDIREPEKTVDSKENRGKGPEPQRHKRKFVSEDEFIASNFRNRVVGECGERFVMAIQRQQWAKLTSHLPDKALKCLEHLKDFYSLNDDTESLEWLRKWKHLKSIEPEVWVGDDNWPLLSSLLYMAKWSTNAGFDILGLLYDKDINEASIVRVEVKATRGKYKLDFPISRNELNAAKYDSDSYIIWRVLNVSQGRIPSYLLFKNPIKLIEQKLIIETDQVTILQPNIEFLENQSIKCR